MIHSVFDEPVNFSAAGRHFMAVKVDASHLQDLLAIERRSHPTPWTQANFISSLTSHLCVGVKQGGAWLGYAILSFASDEAELLLFVIDREWQGRGLAKAFLDLVLQTSAARASTVFLEVRESNLRAIGLYESIGFNQVGVRPNYYPTEKGRRENALLYAMELSHY